ncbi:MAG: hypothetical protein ACK2UW_21980 [Anaerolineales bacterium]|jgi:hypothetical protein
MLGQIHISPTNRVEVNVVQLLLEYIEIIDALRETSRLPKLILAVGARLRFLFSQLL